MTTTKVLTIAAALSREMAEKRATQSEIRELFRDVLVPEGAVHVWPKGWVGPVGEVFLRKPFEYVRSRRTSRLLRGCD
jgi:hypothetical protein